MCAYAAIMGLEDDIRSIMLAAVDSGQYPSLTKLAESAGAQQGSLSRFTRGLTSLRLADAARVLDMLGATICLPGDCKQHNAPLIPPEIAGIHRTIEVMRLGNLDREQIEAAAQAALAKAIKHLLDSPLDQSISARAAG